VQRFGTFLSNMIMPNIPALIAWGLFTALFIDVGWLPNADLATMVGPAIHYLLPILIAVTGGSMVHGSRGAVVGAFATFGVIAGSDLLVAEFNLKLAEGEQPLGQIHMFIGAMIMGPLAAYVMKRLDALWEGKVKVGFEMLVNMFSAGITAFVMSIVGFFVLAPIVNKVMEGLGNMVETLVDNNLLPLTSIIIEPAKVLFLNNAVNHGVLTPLGINQSAETGKSILFLLEANPGPGVGLLIAYSIFGTGLAKSTAPAAAIIQFFGGIHEIYFPYVLMKPLTLLATIGGGMVGILTLTIFNAGLRAPAAPGSIIAVLIQTPGDSFVGVILSVLLAATTSFVIASIILRASRKSDESTDLTAATAQMESMKGKKSSVSGVLTDIETSKEEADEAREAATRSKPIHKIVFACDAGMGSSAMGASVLRNKIKKAGFPDVTVVNVAIANLVDDVDVIVTHQDLTPRARDKAPTAQHISVANFMSSPKDDEIVEELKITNATSST
jgi:PTS system mannitol-specific IIC component